jgi:small subunit ribosomal protein S15
MVFDPADRVLRAPVSTETRQLLCPKPGFTESAGLWYFVPLEIQQLSTLISSYPEVLEAESSVMALAKEAKAEIITSYKTHESDTGSPEVQIALLTKRINELTEHFKTHVKDNHSRRGLLKLVSQRRSLLDYLKRRDINRYHDVINRLGIRK